MKYKLIKKEYIEDIKAWTYCYKHIKSGARVLAIINDDTNKTFSIGFRTPPKDHTGVPHILEHSTLSGSKNFPVKDPFVELLKTSLNTFLNAMTYPDKTVYPVCSCNMKDFKNLMHIYMDAVFYPNVLEKEEIFLQEGWHYELESVDAELKYNGVVYNEMKGAYSSVDEIIGDEVIKTLFPNATYGVSSGGNPRYIPTLTYEMFKEFHHKYYSPSNSYIYLYGDIDLEERLDWMDKEYLSKFDVIDPNSDIVFSKEFTERVESKVYYPLNQADAANKSIYTYNITCGSILNNKDIIALHVLIDAVLESPSSSFNKRFKESGFCKDIDVNLVDEIAEPYITIQANDAKDNSFEEFKTMLFEELNKLVTDGFDRDALLGTINIAEFRIKEADFGRLSKGLIYNLECLANWIYDDDKETDRLKYSDVYKELKEAVDTTYYVDLVKKYFIDNVHASFVEGVPSSSVLNVELNRVKEELAEYKASLSDEELEELVEKTKHLKEYQSTPSSKEELATMPKLSREDLEINAPEVLNRVVEKDGFKVVYHDYETNDISYIKLYFDLKNVSKEELPYVNLLCDVLGSVDTTKRKFADIEKFVKLNTGGLDIRPYVLDKYGRDFYAAIEVSTKVLRGKEDSVLDLIEEIICDHILDSKKEIRTELNTYCSTALNSIMSGGNRVAASLALSCVKPVAQYKECLAGLVRYDAMQELSNDFDNKYEELLNTFRSIINKVFRKENLIVSVTGVNIDITDRISRLCDRLNTGEYIYTPFVFEKKVENEAVIIPGQVNYVAMAGTFDPELYDLRITPFMINLRFDYLWNQVRVLGGAYGVSAQIYCGEFVLASYRDPNVQRTLDVYSKIDEVLENFNPSDEELTQLIIGAMGEKQTVYTPSILGTYAHSLYLGNKTREDIIKEREDMINVTREDIYTQMKNILKQFYECSAIACVGSADAIEKAGDSFSKKREL